MSASRIFRMATGIVPIEARRWLRATQRRFRLQYPRLGTVAGADFWRLTPVSRVFGLDRGLPIDRYYIERFLSTHQADIRGRVLEIGDDFYAREFGGERVERIDVLHAVPGNPKATLVADLTRAESIPSEIFDCVIATQTVQMIYDVTAALQHVHRILSPGGVLLVTCHGISKIARREGVDPWGEYWRFTAQSARRMFAASFPGGNVSVEAYGNVLAAVASLHGLAAEELSQEELDYLDPDYEVLIGIRAVKSGRGQETHKISDEERSMGGGPNHLSRVFFRLQAGTIGGRESEGGSLLIDENYVPKRRSDLNTRAIDGEAVALDRRQGFIHQFNQTANFIWERCDGTLKIREIAGLLSEAFEVDSEAAAQDVVAVVQQLQQLGLLES